MANEHALDDLGRAAYAAYCAMDPIDPERQPDWGRDGYKVEAAVWQTVAAAVISRHMEPEPPAPVDGHGLAASSVDDHAEPPADDVVEAAFREGWRLAVEALFSPDTSVPMTCDLAWEVARAALSVRDAERDRLREALEEARRQLEYLDERFPTGTTPAVLSRIDAALKEARHG